MTYKSICYEIRHRAATLELKLAKGEISEAKKAAAYEELDKMKSLMYAANAIDERNKSQKGAKV